MANSFAIEVVDYLLALLSNPAELNIWIIVNV